MGKMNPKWDLFPLPATTILLASLLLSVNKLLTTNIVCAVEASDSGLSERTENPDTQCHSKGAYCFTVLSYNTPQHSRRFKFYAHLRSWKGVLSTSLLPLHRASSHIHTSGFSGLVKGFILQNRHCTVLSPAEPSLTFSWLPHCHPQCQAQWVDLM